MLKRVLSRQAISITNLFPFSITRSYASSRQGANKVSLEAEELRIKFETKRLQELELKRAKERALISEQKKKEKEAEREKLLKEKQKKALLEQKIKKVKLQHEQKLKEEKQRERLKQIEVKQKKKLQELKKNQKTQETKKKENEGPRRPILAFFWYTSQYFNAVKQELAQAGQDSGLVNVNKTLREKFNALPEDKKKVFLDLEESDKQRYARERSAYLKKKKAARGNRPLTPFFRYTSEARSQAVKAHPEKSATEIAKLLGEQWRSLSDTDKQKYIDAYNQEKESTQTHSH